VRRGEVGLIFLLVAFLSWLLSMMVQPHVTWGDPPPVHESARDSILLASATSLVCLLISAYAVYWRRNGRFGWKEIIFSVVLLFFGGTALARFIYVQFFVFGQLS
jgi:ABC-type sulfate transport system permease component